MFSGMRPRGSRDPREIDPIEDNLAQGLSTQPAHLRFPGQLQDTVNCSFSVVDGARKRPGTHFFHKIGSPGMAPCGNFRLHPIDRDQTERYLVVFGEGQVRIFDTVNGDEATVTIDPDSDAYLWANGATADHLRFRTQDDTTLIVNTRVPASSRRSDGYSVTSTVRDYDVLRSITPADDTYHRTEEDADSFPAGYYKYDVDGATFAMVQFPAVSGIPNAAPGGYYDDSLGGLQFRIYFSKTAGFSGGSFNNGTKTLTKAGAFANAVAGDWVEVSAGTGVTPGWYEIESKTSADAVVLDLDIGGTNPADVVVDHLASRHDVVYAQDNPTLPDMHAVAAKWQTALRNAGAGNALCAWTETGDTQGYFTITSPYRGSGTTIAEIGSTGAGTDVSAAGYMFTASGASITAGSGSGSLTLDIDDRWTAVAAPNQADAEFDPLTMPQKLVRTSKGPGAEFEISPVEWNARTSGDELSNPSPTPISAALTGTITAISAASPGVVTCEDHGLTTGDVIYIHSSDSTPTIDGERTVTVVDPDTFTVGVNTSGAGTAGRWSRGAKPVADVMFDSGRLALAIGDRYIASQAGDVYNFYIENVAEVVDSDPIDVPIGSDGVGIITFMVASQKTTILFTESGVQYERDEAEALTPTTCKFTATTRHPAQPPTYGTRPKNLSSVLYFAGDSESSTILWEYRRDDLQAISTANDVGKHVEGFLPRNVRTLIAAPNANQVYILEENDRSIYVYQAHWEGVTKRQSAWGLYQFDGNYRISDICFLADRVWMLVEGAPPATVSAASPGVITLANHGFSNGDPVAIFDSTTKPSLDGSHTVAGVSGATFNVGVNTSVGGTCRVCRAQYVLESFTTSRESVTPAFENLAAWPYAIHMDRQMTLTGVYDAGNDWTEFTMPTGFAGLGSTINRAVLGPAFGSDAGEVITTGFTYGSTYIRIAGDYSDGEVVLGRFYTMQAEPTRPFLRNEKGQADRLSGLLVKRILVGYVDSGTFNVTVDYDQPGPDSHSTTMDSAASTVDMGELNAPVRSDAAKCSVTILSANPLPVTITGIQWIAEYRDGVK